MKVTRGAPSGHDPTALLHRQPHRLAPVDLVPGRSAQRCSDAGTPAIVVARQLRSACHHQQPGGSIVRPSIRLLVPLAALLAATAMLATLSASNASTSTLPNQGAAAPTTQPDSAAATRLHLATSRLSPAPTNSTPPTWSAPPSSWTSVPWCETTSTASSRSATSRPGRRATVGCQRARP